MRIKYLINTTTIRYDTKLFQARGITVLDMPFNDITFDKKDSRNVENQSFDIIVSKFISTIREAQYNHSNIAIASISGRVRPPMLIACALIAD